MPPGSGGPLKPALPMMTRASRCATANPCTQGSGGRPREARSPARKAGDTSSETRNRRSPSAAGNPASSSNRSGCSISARRWSGEYGSSVRWGVSITVCAPLTTCLRRNESRSMRAPGSFKRSLARSGCSRRSGHPRQIVSKGRSVVCRQLLERPHEVVGPGRAETARAGLEVLQHFAYLSDPSSRLHLTPPLHRLVHQTDIVQRRPAIGIGCRRLHEVSAGLSNPFTGPSLLLLRQVAVLGDDFDLDPRRCSDDPFDVADEQPFLTVLESGDVHHHVDLFGAEVEDFLGLILLHRGRFVAVRKPNHGAYEDTRTSQQFSGEADVVRLHAERGGAEPGCRVGELGYLVPRGVQANDRMVEQLGKAGDL